MDLSGRKMVVIGGAGFIGSHTVDALIEEDVGEIVVFDNFSRGTRENLMSAMRDSRVSIYPFGGDICHRDVLRGALEGAHGVVHLAALWLMHCQEFPRSAFEVNIGGTFNVLEACVTAGVSKVVLASSASVYGDPTTETIEESHPFLNRSLYGATKIADEMLARAYCHRFGLDYVAMRYMNVYGPRQRADAPDAGVVPAMLRAIESNRNPCVAGDGLQKLDFVHVRDCARANVLALATEATDLCVNIGTGVGITILELARMLLEMHPCGRDLRLEYGPASAVRVRNRVADSSLARDALGFISNVKFADGLRELVAVSAAASA